MAIFGRRVVIVRVATRALKALRASTITLRPRSARLTALTARAATRLIATIDGPQRKCLTMVGAGVTVGSSSPAVVRSPSASPDVEHVRIGGLRPRFPLLKPLPGCPFVRRHVRGTDNRIGLRFGLRPSADPTVQQTSTSSRCHGGTPVRSRCVGRCAQRAHHREPQPHRRSEWAGVSWPEDDDHERDAAGGGALARRQGMPHRPITPQMLRSVLSFARWRARPHVSASSEN
jgi:hypothetical protein